MGIVFTLHPVALLFFLLNFYLTIVRLEYGVGIEIVKVLTVMHCWMAAGTYMMKCKFFSITFSFIPHILSFRPIKQLTIRINWGILFHIKIFDMLLKTAHKSMQNLFFTEATYLNNKVLSKKQKKKKMLTFDLVFGCKIHSFMGFKNIVWYS